MKRLMLAVGAGYAIGLGASTSAFAWLVGDGDGHQCGATLTSCTESCMVYDFCTEVTCCCQVGPNERHECIIKIEHYHGNGDPPCDDWQCWRLVQVQSTLETVCDPVPPLSPYYKEAEPTASCGCSLS